MNYNYDKTLIDICKIILEQSNKYTITTHHLAKSNKESILGATNLFPVNISYSKRIRAIATNDLCVCKQCKSIHGDIDSAGFCNKKCYHAYKAENVITTEERNTKLIENSITKYKDNVEGYDYIICKECGFHGAELTTHIKTHGLTPDEYKIKYNTESVKCKKLIDKVSGKNNPGYQHGGKFSPFSEKFIYADTTNIKELYQQVSKTRTDNDNDTTKLSYWLKKTGGNVDEAQRLLSERQSTFSLEKCVKKYGEEEGIKVWRDRQERWIQSYNDKSYEELEEINKKKSNQLSYSSLWKNESSSTGQFYFIDIHNGFYKIGITSRSLEKRYNNTNYDIILNFNSTISHCFQIEQILKKEYSSFGISKNEQLSEFGWTETFKNINLLEILCRIEELKDEEYTTKLFKETFNLKYAENF